MSSERRMPQRITVGEPTAGEDASPTTTTGSEDSGDVENSDDSVTSGSEALADSSGDDDEDDDDDSDEGSPSSSSFDADDADDDEEKEQEQEEDDAQDLSFADRVARENRRSRRHQLSRLRAAPAKATKATATRDRNDSENRSEQDAGSKPKSKTFTRDNKHRPVEMSSKKRVSVLRDATLGLGDGSGLMKKRRVRDPRFDSLGGDYSEKAFKKRYSFIFDEKLPEERRELKESLSKIKSERKRERLQRKLQKITQQIKTEENRRKQEARHDKVMQRHKEATKGQAKKFHLKKSDIKKQELMLKYEELQASGGLERYMEKRRKRNAAKDHRYMPGRKEKET